MYAHGDQKYGEHPYVYHLDAVAEICKPYEKQYPLIRDLAYVHDVVEDTPYSIYELYKGTNNEYFAECVRLLTDQEGKNRRTRKYRTYMTLSWIDENGPYAAVLVVKAADRLANLRETIKTLNREKYIMYEKERAAFIAVCRLGLCPEIWQEIYSILEDKQLREKMYNLP